MRTIKMAGEPKRLPRKRGMVKPRRPPPEPVGVENAHFCLLPKSVMGAIKLLFVRYTGVVIPVPLDPREHHSPWWKELDNGDDLWLFLRSRPQIMVVLITDAEYTARDRRTEKLAPLLKTRVIGAIERSDDNPMIAIQRWLERYSVGNPYVIMDNRLDLYQVPASIFVPITSERGLNEMDLAKVADLLRIQNEILFDPALSNVDKLMLAANLYLCGQSPLTDILFARLATELELSLSSMPTTKRYACSSIFAVQSDSDKFYRLANFLGVRLSVIAEPITEVDDSEPC